ncbi:MAG: hypothetical protein KKB51_03100 [Candidatus Riflebacteria bacterium]|nr:hypothetical protein [Candidatus Riflebacteria bacterium]
MKETKTVEIAQKHREDVIDTLQLRSKERRVLYALLIFFICTVAYENSALIMSRLVGDSHPLPELGERRHQQLTPDQLKRLDRALAEASEGFPQYWARFADNQNRLAEAMTLLAEEGKADAAQEKLSLVVASMFEFATHPIIKSTKDLEKVVTELKSLRRTLKLKTDIPELEIKPLSFVRETEAESSQPRRDLFEYTLR